MSALNAEGAYGKKYIYCKFEAFFTHGQQVGRAKRALSVWAATTVHLRIHTSFVYGGKSPARRAVALRDGASDGARAGGRGGGGGTTSWNRMHFSLDVPYGYNVSSDSADRSCASSLLQLNWLPATQKKPVVRHIDRLKGKQPVPSRLKVKDNEFLKKGICLRLTSAQH